MLHEADFRQDTALKLRINLATDRFVGGFRRHLSLPLSRWTLIVLNGLHPLYFAHICLSTKKEAFACFFWRISSPCAAVKPKGTVRSFSCPPAVPAEAKSKRQSNVKKQPLGMSRCSLVAGMEASPPAPEWLICFAFDQGAVPSPGRDAVPAPCRGQKEVKVPPLTLFRIECSFIQVPRAECRLRADLVQIRPAEAR